MDIFNAVLASQENQIYIERSGMATRCRLAVEAMTRGRTVVLLAREREDYTLARALLTLCTPELSLGEKSLSEPLWRSPCLAQRAWPPCMVLGLGSRAVWCAALKVFCCGMCP